MSDATFQEFTESFDEAIAHARGQKTGVRIT
jgi:hypothetical protein